MRCLTMPARLLLLGTLFASSAGVAQADPLNFSNVRLGQLGSTSWIPLFDNPGLVVTLTEDRILSFFTDVAGTLPEGGTDTIRFTWQGPGQPTVVQSFPIPIFGTGLPPFTLGNGTVFPVTYTPQAWELIVELLNSSPDFTIPSGPNAGVQVDSYTYSFSTVSPVPEPGTMLLLASGLALAAARQRRRKTLHTIQ